jgi:hypothetical protein
MIVVKFKFNAQTQGYEEIRRFENVQEDKVFVEATTDLPVDVLTNAGYLYEAGEVIGDRFIPSCIWHSNNPNLFD